MSFPFFFNDPATTEIYTLSLHDALPISECAGPGWVGLWCLAGATGACRAWSPVRRNGPRSAGSCCTCQRSEEHTSELQSRPHLVCRLLLEKKKLSLKSPYC